MGLSPNTWGKQFWHSIHAIALAYPESPTDEQKMQYKDFFDRLPGILPCVFCGNALRENYKKLPIRLDSQRELTNWTIDLHNLVNRETGKKTLSYDEAIEQFKKNTKKQIDPIYYLGAGVFIGVAGLLIANSLARGK